MPTRKNEHRVRFLLPSSCSRPARDDEAQVVKAFGGHVHNCATCQIDHLRAISVLCNRGCRLATDLQHLLVWRDGDVQSSLLASIKYWSERVEIPDRESIAERFLKNAAQQDRRRESPAPVIHHDYDMSIRRQAAFRWRTRTMYYHRTVRRCQFMTVRET